MAIIIDQCYKCQNLIEIEVKQTVIHEKLRWYLSYDCPFCSTTIEIDDINLPPEDIRQKVFIEEGEWEIIVKNIEKHKQSILKCLHQTFAQPKIELYQKLKELKAKPGAICNGTKFEMEWVYSCLQVNGVESIVVRRKENSGN